MLHSQWKISHGWTCFNYIHPIMHLLTLGQCCNVSPNMGSWRRKNICTEMILKIQVYLTKSRLHNNLEDAFFSCWLNLDKINLVTSTLLWDYFYFDLCDKALILLCTFVRSCNIHFPKNPQKEIILLCQCTVKILKVLFFLLFNFFSWINRQAIHFFGLFCKPLITLFCFIKNCWSISSVSLTWIITLLQKSSSICWIFLSNLYCKDKLIW